MSVRTGDIASLAALLLVLPTSLLAAPRRFQEIIVATIPCGQSVDEIAIGLCEGDEELPNMFAFLGANNAVYLYDGVARNLKIVGAGRQGISTILGPPIRTQAELPYDGSIGQDGSIYLLADTGALRDRLRIYYRTPGAASWKSMSALDDMGMGWQHLGSGRIPVLERLRIGTEPSGDVALFDLSRRSGKALVVASGGRILPPASRRWLPALSSRAAPIAQFLGLDGAGREALITYRSDREWFFLERLDRRGALSAEVMFPRRTNRQLLSGKGGHQLAVNGDVYEMRITDAGFVVSRWTVGGAQ